MPTKDELLPCPHCGGKAELNGAIFGDGSEYDYRVECKYCGGWYLIKQEAIKAWNTRHTPSCDQCKHCGEIKRHTIWCNELDISLFKDFHCAKYERKQ